MDNPYQKLEKIGAGSFSTVYKGVHKETKQLVAIKILNLDTAEALIDEVADIRTEISLLTQLKLADVQNVTRYYGSHLFGSKLWIIMDYCHGGSIRTLMEAGRFEEKYIAIIMREVLLALAYVHKCGIIHRDIKAANILMANDGRIQLCDFGVATQLAANHLKRNTFVGTPYWMAPEVITEGSMYNFKADIWSLGITVYEIATTRPPYADQEQMRALFLIPRSQPARLDGPGFTPQIKEFVGLCLQIAPDARPTADELSKTRFVKGTSKMPTSTLRDLITRYARWQESGGVRQSIMISNRRGSSVSNEENEPDFEHDDVIAWDFDTSFADVVIPPSSEEQFLSPTSSFDRPMEQTSTLETIQTRPLRGTSQGQGNPASAPVVPPISTSNATEHPLEQLFNDGTIRSATAPPTLRPRKDTVTSRPLSPLPPLNGSATQPSSPDMESRPGMGLGTGSYDLRLPDITPIAPIQIEIPAAEETLRKDVPGVRSRSTTVTRGTRSDSTGSAGFSSRTPRHNTAEPMPPPHFSTVSVRSESPKPPPPPLHPLLPTPLPSQITPSVSVPKSHPPPMSPPKSTSAVPPPTSPTKGHISSKSVPNNAPLSVTPLNAPSQEHMLMKARSSELKSSRAPHLTLNLPNQNTHVLPSELSPQGLSGVRSRSATTSEGLTATTATPIITAIPPSPAFIHDLDFALPSLAPLNLSVLTEEASTGNGAGRLLTDELERILLGMSGILDVVGNGLSALESQTRPIDIGTKTSNGDFDFGSMRDDNDGIRDRLDSLTSSFTSGGTMIRRS